MIAFNIACHDSIGAAARITGALREAKINTRGLRFTTKQERYGLFGLFSRTVGEGVIVVKDEDWDIVSHQLLCLAKDRKNLDLRVGRPYYHLTLEISDQFGALDEHLQKFAQNGINILYINVNDPGDKETTLARIEFACSPRQYDQVKKLLVGPVVWESPYLATAVRDL